MAKFIIPCRRCGVTLTKRIIGKGTTCKWCLNPKKCTHCGCSIYRDKKTEDENMCVLCKNSGIKRAPGGIFFNANEGETD